LTALNGGVALQRLGDVHGHTTNGGLSVELAERVDVAIEIANTERAGQEIKSWVQNRVQ